MNLNKAQLQALASKICSELNKKYHELSKVYNEELDAFAESSDLMKEQLELNRKFIRELRNKDEVVKIYVRQHLSNNGFVPTKPLPPYPNLGVIRDEIVLATIGSENLDAIVETVTRKFS